ncbi:hypothetical protein Pmani_005573 [Petrolisthes manimaculis]|uniref:Uncharacterized protein n=1 Tax=Petrolisthes manimaculis TaxID=1843537 RepID=A0AAE1QCF1_9EUCA|nr:hypothetical protein Pmani_005573 [Petrolisthes manimaculis]
MSGSNPQEDIHYNRRLRGTPTVKFRNRASLAVLAASILVGVAFHFTPGAQRYRKRLLEGEFNNSEETQMKGDMIFERLREDFQKSKKKEEMDGFKGY